MSLYILLALFYILCIPIENEVLKKISKKTWATLLFLPLFLLSAFREPSVGTDTINYMNMYDTFMQESLFAPIYIYIEVGYVFINRLMGAININYYGFQFIYSAFVYYILILFVSKYSKNIAFSVFFYVSFRLFFFSLNVMRQMIAMIIVVISIPYIVQRKPFKFLSIVGIAALVHSTAILFSLLYFVTKLKIHPRNIIKIFALTLTVLFGGQFFINIYLNYFPKYSTYINRMDDYNGTFVYIQTLIIFSYVLLGTILQQSQRTFITSNKIGRTSYLGMPILNKLVNMQGEFKKLKDNFSIDAVIFAAVILSFVFSLLSLEINIAGRITKYFTILIMVYLPNLLETIKDKHLKFLSYLIIVSCLFVYYIVVFQFRPEWDGIIPFKWKWSS